MAHGKTNEETRSTPRPPWRARTVWIAAGLALLGVVLWVGLPEPVADEVARSGVESGLTDMAGESVTEGVESWRGSPALFRFGLSYMAGFFLGYGLRRFIGRTIVGLGLAVGVVFVIQHFGWVQLDWGSIESHLKESFAWLQGQAEALRVFVMGYVPSAGAAGVGLFLGARWR